MKAIQFKDQDGGGTGEVAGEKWLVGGELQRSHRIRGILVNAPAGEEGWVQLRDTSTVEETTEPFCTVQAKADSPSEFYNFPGKGFPLENGLYLKKPNNSIIYIYVD